MSIWTSPTLWKNLEEWMVSYYILCFFYCRLQVQIPLLSLVYRHFLFLWNTMICGFTPPYSWIAFILFFMWNVCVTSKNRSHGGILSFRHTLLKEKFYSIIKTFIRDAEEGGTDCSSPSPSPSVFRAPNFTSTKLKTPSAPVNPSNKSQLLHSFE